MISQTRRRPGGGGGIYIGDSKHVTNLFSEDDRYLGRPHDKIHPALTQLTYRVFTGNRSSSSS